MKKSILWALASAGAIMLVGCGDSNPTPPDLTNTVTINPVQVKTNKPKEEAPKIIKGSGTLTPISVELTENHQQAIEAGILAPDGTVLPPNKLPEGVTVLDGNIPPAKSPESPAP